MAKLCGEPPHMWGRDVQCPPCRTMVCCLFGLKCPPPTPHRDPIALSLKGELCCVAGSPPPPRSSSSSLNGGDLGFGLSLFLCRSCNERESTYRLASQPSHPSQPSGCPSNPRRYPDFTPVLCASMVRAHKSGWQGRHGWGEL